jgi:TM2 domain-containing membrane protein YozV
MAGSPPQGYPPQGPQVPPQPYGQHHGQSPNAPYGVDPRTGLPYSDKQKVLVGVLQLIPIVVGIGGIGRLYAGHTGIGVAQLLLSCIAIGGIWSIIDGIIILVSDNTTDGDGLPLRPN